MHEMAFASWEEFQVFLAEYCQRPLSRRRQLIFRGHSSSAWKLETTLDREHPAFGSDEERESFLTNLLRRFRRETMQLDVEDAWQLRGEALEFKARHHGLPTPILDWTESPYIASYFAFAGASVAKDKQVAVWMLDRALLAEDLVGVTIIDDEELLARNHRALRQRGIVMRVRSTRRTVEEYLGESLVKFLIPAADAEQALAQLDEMTITATTLFADLDSAASTVHYREFRN